jgi:DNA-binding response OmpR family regulator
MPQDGPRILLGEDDPELRSLIVLALAQDGCVVDELPHDGTLADAARVVVSRPIADLIVCDVLMPGWSGLQLLEHLARCEWPTPVLLITAFGEPALEARAARFGAVAVMSKPFDLDDLRTVVNALVRPHGWRRRRLGET